MADANTNPYLALLQQEEKPPGWAQILQHIGNLGFGLAGGFGQAAATGQPTMNAIGPGLMMGNQLNAQAAHQAEQERMKRLELQFKAQEHEDKRAEMIRKEKQLQLLAGQYGPNAAVPGFNATQPTGPLMGPGTPDQNAIGGIESGGRYDAIGPVANNKGQRAYGKYQIMDFNIGPWTQEVLGKPMTPQEFLANPQAQDAVFNTKFGQYSQKYGPVGASRAWFAGEGGMNNPNASDVNGMTVQRYGDRFAQSRGVAAAPVGPPPVGLGGAGPTLSALPAFEGPGTGTIQPGALAAGAQPSVNLPAPYSPPPQVAQGDAVTPGGSPVDPNAQPPPAVSTAPAAPTAPGGPVQPNYTPTQGTPSMAPADIPPPPAPVLPDRPTLTQADSARLQSLVLGGHPEQAMSEYNRLLTMQRSEVMDRHRTEVEVWRQRQEGARHERGEQARLKAEERAQTRQLEAEQRRAEQEQKNHERTIAEQQKVREDAAKASGDKLSFEKTKFMTETENGLRDDFNAAPPVRSYRIVVPMLESAKDAEKRPTRAADLNLVYAFAKIMDPDSVVRESETAGVTATASVSDRLSAYVGQLNGQAMLNPDVRAKLMKELDSRFRALEESYQVHERAYASIAERRGLHRDNIIVPIRGPKPAEDNKPADAKPDADVPVYDTTGKRIK